MNREQPGSDRKRFLCYDYCCPAERERESLAVRVIAFRNGQQPCASMQPTETHFAMCVLRMKLKEKRERLEDSRERACI